jgi:hypothetical protein
MQIEFGPFKTQHHNSVVDARFRQALYAWIRRRVFPELSSPPNRISGRLWSNYDDEKYFGPLSAIKYRYQLELVSHVAGGTDEVNVTLDYGPSSGTFADDKVPLRVDTPAKKQDRNLQLTQVMDVFARYLRGERGITCPRCGGVLEISCSPNAKIVKGVRCLGCEEFRAHFG